MRSESKQANSIGLPIKISVALLIIVAMVSFTGCINKEKLKATFGENETEAPEERGSDVVVLKGTSAARPLLEFLVESLSGEWTVDMMIEDGETAREQTLSGEADFAIYDETGFGAYDGAEAADADEGAILLLAQESALFIVNEESAEETIYSDEFLDLLTDQNDALESGQPVTLVLPAMGSPAWNAIDMLFGMPEQSGDEAPIYDEDITLPTTALLLKSDDEVVANVATDPLALGIVGSGTLLDDVKALRVDDIEPESANYPAVVHLLLLMRDEESPSAKDLLASINAEQGKTVLSECGFTPIVIEE